MAKRLPGFAITILIFAVSLIVLHPLATRQIGFIERLGRVRYDDAITALPVSEISGIALISPNSKDAPQDLTDDELERMKELLEPVEFKGKGQDFSIVPDGTHGRQIQITLSSGEEFTFGVGSSIYFINAQEVVCYRSHNKEQASVCAAIEKLHSELLEKYFPNRTGLYC